MPSTFWVSVAAFVLSGLAFFMSRKDKQSEKSALVLERHEEQLERVGNKVQENEREIDRLRGRISELEKENVGLRDENMRLMRIVLNCPSPNCPVLPDERTQPGRWDGLERRKRPR